jgi:hypothetical protein|tara:strand:+ start:18443 stop:18670 length:228 start_codon:yes stop_codon:yes gene_type:complete
MARFLKVEQQEYLMRDTESGGIVNTNSSEYELYMKRIQMRKGSVNQMKSMCREINSLKQELFEIKDLIKNMCKDK